MAQAVLDSGHLPPGEEDDLLDFGLDAEQNVMTIPGAEAPEAADPNEFDFQIGGVEDAEVEGTGQGSPEAVGKELVESEIGYEDEEEPSFGNSDHETTHRTDAQAVDGAENHEEINYEDEGNTVIQDPPAAHEEFSEPTNLDQSGDQHYQSSHLDEKVDTGDLDFDPEFEGATETDQGGFEDYQAEDDVGLQPETDESAPGHGQPPSTEDDHLHANTEGEASGAGQPVSNPSDVVIIYNKVEYQLCAKEDNNDPDTYFFAQDTELDYPLARFLSCIREVICDEIGPEEEIFIRVVDLQLEFGENSNEIFLEQTTCREIINLHRQFQQNDGVTEYFEPVLELFTRPACTQRFSELLDAVDSGIGLTGLHEYLCQPEFSGHSSPSKDTTGHDYPDDAPTEGEEQGSREPDAEPLAEDDLLGYDAPDIEAGATEDAHVAEPGVTDTAAIDERVASVADSGSNFQQDVEPVEHAHHSDNPRDDDPDAEDELDYQALEDEEPDNDTTRLEGNVASEQQNIIDESNFLETDIFAGDGPLEYDDGYALGSSDHPLDQVATGNASAGDNGAEHTDQVEEDGEGDEFGDEIGVAPAGAASASVATAHSDSITYSRSGHDMTHVSTHEAEHEQIEYGYDEESQDSRVVANSRHVEDPTVPTGLGVAGSAHSESPTSTIKGDEISYEEDLDVGDSFDVELEGPADSSEQIVDEIDWDNDGDDDKIEGIEEQDPAKLTPSSASVKRRRELNDLDSPAEDSADAKRRRT